MLDYEKTFYHSSSVYDCFLFHVTFAKISTSDNFNPGTVAVTAVVDFVFGFYGCLFAKLL